MVTMRFEGEKKKDMKEPKSHTLAKRIHTLKPNNIKSKPREKTQEKHLQTHKKKAIRY